MNNMLFNRLGILRIHLINNFKEKIKIEIAIDYTENVKLIKSEFFISITIGHKMFYFINTKRHCFAIWPYNMQCKVHFFCWRRRLIFILILLMCQTKMFYEPQTIYNVENSTFMTLTLYFIPGIYFIIMRKTIAAFKHRITNYRYNSRVLLFNCATPFIYNLKHHIK